MRALLIVILLAACGAQRPSEDPRLARVDTFGSAWMTREVLLREHGDTLARAMEAFDRGDDDAGGALVMEVVGALEATRRFAFVEPAMVQYHDPPVWYVTIDVVDEADRARRMTFAPAPTLELPDPDGLLALWGEYEDRMREVLDPGAQATTTCPAFHCLGGFDHPELARYGAAFEARVPLQEAALRRVLRDDRDDLDRAYAAYLLAHLDDGARVVDALVPALRDPSVLVRNNAMRVLAMIGWDHPQVEIPLEPVLATIRFPATLDRNKAFAILSSLSRREPLRARIADEAGDVLVAMMRLRQPNNRSFAYQTLKNISGEDLGENAGAWEEWLRVVRSRR